MKIQTLICTTLVGLCCAVTACNHSGPKETLPQNVQATPKFNRDSIELFSGALKPDVKIVIESPAAQQEFTGNRADVLKVAGSSAPNAEVSVIRSDKTTAGDALTFSWRDSWRASLNFETKNPINIAEYMSAGVVEFDLKVVELGKGGLAFKSKCGENCVRQIPYLIHARDLEGKGWKHFSLPLKCFMRDGDDFSSVTLPFALEAGGSGIIEVAKVHIQKTGTPSFSCPDYKTLSTTPAVLNEWWSMGWWMPRHLEKLKEVKAKKNAEVIFIGDSITQGWEKDGFNVWNHNYVKYNAINLGFSGDRTENVLWRLQHSEIDGLNPKVAVLMFGTNNTGHRLEDPKTTALGIKRNIEELQQHLPNTKILLLAIFPRDEKPTDQMRQLNDEVNVIISGFADNKKLFFLNINKSLLDANGILSKDIMPDLLHPNEKGYEIWAKAMAPTLLKLVK
ncbi:MAG: 1,4-beta-D-glucan glucohydrolase [Gammaproteobacteria bacterium]|nr:MAG: 1,4-beta-D-glucan glucohydrolase [Gammaproteobacteria bacterium]